MKFYGVWVGVALVGWLLVATVVIVGVYWWPYLLAAGAALYLLRTIRRWARASGRLPR